MAAASYEAMHGPCVCALQLLVRSAPGLASRCVASSQVPTGTHVPTYLRVAAAGAHRCATMPALQEHSACMLACSNRSPALPSMGGCRLQQAGSAGSSSAGGAWLVLHLASWQAAAALRPRSVSLAKPWDEPCHILFCSVT